MRRLRAWQFWLTVVLLAATVMVDQSCIVEAFDTRRFADIQIAVATTALVILLLAACVINPGRGSFIVALSACIWAVCIVLLWPSEGTAPALVIYGGSALAFAFSLGRSFPSR